MTTPSTSTSIGSVHPPQELLVEEQVVLEGEQVASKKDVVEEEEEQGEEDQKDVVEKNTREKGEERKEANKTIEPEAKENSAKRAKTSSAKKKRGSKKPAETKDIIAGIIQNNPHLGSFRYSFTNLRMDKVEPDIVSPVVKTFEEFCVKFSLLGHRPNRFKIIDKGKQRKFGVDCAAP